jgi:hypothetical protein
VPGYLDRKLAREGYDSQQTDEAADPRGPTNLWDPVPGDHGAHGRFDDRARSRSLQAWLTRHRGPVALGAVGGALTAALVAKGVRSSS